MKKKCNTTINRALEVDLTLTEIGVEGSLLQHRDMVNLVHNERRYFGQSAFQCQVVLPFESRKHGLEKRDEFRRTFATLANFGQE